MVDNKYIGNIFPSHPCSRLPDGHGSDSFRAFFLFKLKSSSKAMASTARIDKVKLRVAPLVAQARPNLKKTLSLLSVHAIVLELIE